MSKTSTFTIHHDRCNPAKWTAPDVLALANFVKFGDISYAAALARLGLQLVVSEHHVPKGGTLEQIGWIKPGSTEICDINDIDGASVSELCRVYSGPVEYICPIAMGDGDGNFDGYDYESKPTLPEAEAFMSSLREPERA